MNHLLIQTTAILKITAGLKKILAYNLALGCIVY